jgi:pectate lyase
VGLSTEAENMKRLCFILPVLLILRLHAVEANTPAEGFGAAARGGEGGRVIRVTNLADEGTGSLRDALAQRGARIIHFAVEGEVELKSRLRIREGSVTLDASTAPGAGITLKRHGLDVVNAEDVIVRGLRIHVSEGGTSGDGILLWGKEGGVTRRVLVEHCSIHGATDEGVNTWGRVEDATFQWCLIADAAPPHSKGWLSGAECDRITLHHCLLAGCDDRNPKLEGGHYQVVNNVFAAWKNNNATKLRLGARVNLLGNFYLPGATSNAAKGCVFIEEPPGALSLFMQGNVLKGQPTTDEWNWVTLHERVAGGWNEKRPAPQSYRAAVPFEAPEVKTESTADALQSVLKQAGALPRDERDARVIERVRAME